MITEKTKKPFKQFQNRLKEIMNRRPSINEINRLNRVFEKDIEDEKHQNDENHKRSASSNSGAEI